MTLLTKKTMRAMCGGLIAATGCGGHEATRKPRAASTVVTRTEDAVARSQHVSVQRAEWLLRRQNALSVQNADLRSKMNPTTLGGSWIDGKSGRLVVAVTKDSVNNAGTSADVKTKTVENSLPDLNALKDKVDQVADQDDPENAGWFVDEPNNAVTVQIPAPDMTAPGTAKFVADVRALGTTVRIDPIPAAPRNNDDIQNGDRIAAQSEFCTAGWAVRDASGRDLLMTAGHCLEADAGPWARDGVSIGTDAGHDIAPDDWGLIGVDAVSTARPTSRVNLFNGTIAQVGGQTELPVGSTVCKSGATSKQTCGRITAVNVAGKIGGEKFTDRVFTDLCSQPGDSGAPVYQIDPDKPGQVIALGVNITGNDTTTCKKGVGESFTPIDRALKDSNTTLVVSQN
jgi:streptogrisin C